MKELQTNYNVIIACIMYQGGVIKPCGTTSYGGGIGNKNVPTSAGSNIEEVD
jgi:hypothetical protein